MRFYPDACVVIYFVERRAGFFAHLEPRFRAALRAKDELVTSELVRLECRIGPLKAADAAALIDFERFFVHMPRHWCDWSRSLFDLAAQLRVHHRLKAIDALHLAAAIESGCDEFWTNDGRLASAAENRIRIVNITQPTP